jgi:hypothetical protein
MDQLSGPCVPQTLTPDFPVSGLPKVLTQSFQTYSPNATEFPD